jgi:hypothetical protein
VWGWLVRVLNIIWYPRYSIIQLYIYTHSFAIVHLGAFCIDNATTLVATSSCPVATGLILVVIDSCQVATISLVAIGSYPVETESYSL